MQEPAEGTWLARFGAFEVTFAAGELRKHGVRLNPRTTLSSSSAAVGASRRVNHEGGDSAEVIAFGNIRGLREWVEHMFGDEANSNRPCQSTQGFLSGNSCFMRRQ
jgi:hypothetical protein